MREELRMLRRRPGNYDIGFHAKSCGEDMSGTGTRDTLDVRLSFEGPTSNCQLVSVLTALESKALWLILG